MKITPMEIMQQHFKKRMFGVDPAQVEAFLERTADAVEDLVAERKSLVEANALLEAEIRGYHEREEAFRESVIHAREVMEGMKENARKEAELIVSEAEVKAENIVNQAHQSFAAIKEDIADLKRLRASIDIQIRGVLAAHKKVLDISREESQAVNARDAKVAVFKK